ncbi:MAG: glycosyltransferase family 4 protein [Patescibacteria group bacterium]
MKILFISHSYPPIVGGVESQNFELYTWLSRIAEVKLLANRKRWLIPFFLKYASVRALFSAKNYDVVLLGSCLLSPVGWLIKKFTRTPVISVAHGLDLTWKNLIYQKLWLRNFIPSLDKLIAIGQETIAVGTERGIPKEKFVLVPNGVDTEKFWKSHTREELEKVVGEKLDDKKILLTTGRLAVHKGVDWFVDQVMPKMGKDVIYLIAGEGEKRKDIEKAIKKNNLEDQVKMLGYVSDADREILYNTADVYIKPNIKVPGTMEGFGLVVVEAASCKLPVVASRLEGLKDAIRDGENGFLIEPYDTDGFVKKIKELLEDENYRVSFGEKARKYVMENFAWEKIAGRYAEEISKIIRKK